MKQSSLADKLMIAFFLIIIACPFIFVSKYERPNVSYEILSPPTVNLVEPYFGSWKYDVDSTLANFLSQYPTLEAMERLRADAATGRNLMHDDILISGFKVLTEENVYELGRLHKHEDKICGLAAYRRLVEDDEDAGFVPLLLQLELVDGALHMSLRTPTRAPDREWLIKQVTTLDSENCWSETDIDGWHDWRTFIFQRQERTSPEGEEARGETDEAEADSDAKAVNDLEAQQQDKPAGKESEDDAAAKGEVDAEIKSSKSDDTESDPAKNED